jgi:hypothetical protein
MSNGVSLLVFLARYYQILSPYLLQTLDAATNGRDLPPAQRGMSAYFRMTKRLDGLAVELGTVICGDSETQGFANMAVKHEVPNRRFRRFVFLLWLRHGFTSGCEQTQQSVASRATPYPPVALTAIRLA